MHAFIKTEIFLIYCRLTKIHRVLCCLCARVTSLKNRFKEFRRTPSKREAKECLTAKRSRKKMPGIIFSPLHPVPAQGEDSVSYERHNRVLQQDFVKRRRNQQVVDELMSCSFAMRRNEILAKSFDLHDLFEKFPFLQESGQVWKLFCYTLIRDVNLEALHMPHTCNSTDNNILSCKLQRDSDFQLLTRTQILHYSKPDGLETEDSEKLAKWLLLFTRRTAQEKGQ